MLAPRVHAQRAASPARSSALACGLVGYFVVLRGPGVHRRRAQPRRLHRRARRRSPLGLDLRLGLFAATIAVGVVHRRCSGRRAAPTTSSSARLRLDPRPRRALPPLFTTHAAAPATAPPASACCSARSSGSAPASVGSPSSGGRGRPARCCWRSPGRCCSPASTGGGRARGVPVRAARARVPRALGVDAAEATPGGRRAAAARPARRAGGRRAAADRADPSAGLALSAAIAVGLRLDRPDAQLRFPRAPPQLGDRVRDRGSLPGGPDDHRQAA